MQICSRAGVGCVSVRLASLWREQLRLFFILRPLLLLFFITSLQGRIGDFAQHFIIVGQPVTPKPLGFNDVPCLLTRANRCTQKRFQINIKYALTWLINFMRKCC
jgi:hypothetical protein